MTRWREEIGDNSDEENEKHNREAKILYTVFIVKPP